MEMLTKEQILQLIKNGDENTIRVIIENQYIPDCAQVEFIKLGNKGLIKFFFSQLRPFWRLWEDAQIELIKLGDKELIELYLEGYGLHKSAQLALIKFGDADLVTLQIRRYGLHKDVQLELFELYKSLLTH